VEPSVGPSTAVYADNVPPFRDFCQAYRPNATGLFEGISPGWRDLYKRNLAFQWVDASNVIPGEYWLGEEVNPLGKVKETGGGSGKKNFATTPTIVPGFDAQPRSVKPEGHPVTVTLTSTAWADKNTPSYKIVSPPAHGKLGEIKGNQVTYTPEPGYTEADSFQFSASDPNSKFPEHPAAAAVVLEGLPPSIAISGAQSEMTAGTSVQLTASVVDDPGAVEWSASGGSVAPSGPLSRQGTFQAPREAGVVTVTARLADNKAIVAQQTIRIAPVPAPKPAPEVPVSEPAPAPGPPPIGSGVAGTKAESPKPSVSRPQAAYIGNFLVMTTRPTVAGRVRLSAYSGKHLLGTCATQTPGGRRFTCRIKLRSTASRHSRVSVLASLRVGSLVVGSRLPAERIPEMRMKPAGKGARIASGSHVYWCSPSTLVPTLSGGEE